MSVILDSFPYILRHFTTSAGFSSHDFLLALDWVHSDKDYFRWLFPLPVESDTDTDSGASVAGQDPNPWATVATVTAKLMRIQADPQHY